MDEIAISVTDVSKCYRVFESQASRLMNTVYPRYTKGMDEVWALKNINFEIKRGEAVAIIGRNGGGKSTLLEILTGTLTPTAGTVKVNGRVSALLELGSGFNPEYSGRDNVILNGLLLGLSKNEIISRFSEIEAFAEIGVAIDRPVKTYSTGMMMRLAFAVQVLFDPDILIIDEALSVGDFFFQQKCFSYIFKLREKGVTLIFVSHDMGAVREVCSRGMLLNSGLIGYDGNNLEAIRHYFQSMDDAPIEVLQPVLATVKKQQATPSSQMKLMEPMWCIGSINQASKNIKVAHLIAVGIYDENGDSVTSAQLGSFVRIKVHLKLGAFEDAHINLVIKNRYDQIITATGSHNLRVPSPSLGGSREVIFELEIQLSIEAGDYSIAASLAIPSSTGISGLLIDETPWMGPFHVLWDYSKKAPPFFGLAGMVCSGKFLVLD